MPQEGGHSHVRATIDLHFKVKKHRYKHVQEQSHDSAMGTVGAIGMMGVMGARGFQQS